MSGEAPMRKVLVITYYWPPAGGPGVQRVLKFVKYLPHFGWEPIILTVRGGEYPALDEGLVEDVPPGVTVVGIPAKPLAAGKRPEAAGVAGWYVSEGEGI